MSDEPKRRDDDLSSPSDVTGSHELYRLAQRGIELCRRGQWQRGAPYLKAVAEAPTKSRLPECFYSYLGCCLAGLEGRNREGLALCRRAIELEFYHPENYLNLARIYAAAGPRSTRLLMDAVEKGLALDPAHRELLELRAAHNTRRRSAIPFLRRDHRLNRFLGRLRHRLRGDVE